jgi:hypothetical protein
MVALSRNEARCADYFSTNLTSLFRREGEPLAQSSVPALPYGQTSTTFPVRPLSKSR